MVSSITTFNFHKFLGWLYRSIVLLTLAPLSLIGAAVQAQTATIRLQWDPPASIAGVTGYHVYIRPVSGSYTSSFYSVPGAGTTSTTITNLTPGSYFMLVKSTNNIAESTPSNEIGITALPITLQGATAVQTQGTAISAQAFAPGHSTILSDSTPTTNASGIIAISGGSAGLPALFDLRLNAPGYLARKIVNRALTDTGAAPALFAGDLDDSGIINSIDYSIMKQGWLSTSTTADINKDGIVNSFDYSYLKGNWFRADEN